METGTVAQMTPLELKEMLEGVVEYTVERKLLEILGVPDEGLEIRDNVRERLLRQKQSVASGDLGRPIEELVEELGLD